MTWICIRGQLLMTLIFPDEPHLVDVDAGDGRTSTACRCCQTDLSSLSSHRADFEQAVVDRDGSCVVCDNSRIICHASHIIPHSKGNEVRIRRSDLSSLLNTQSIYRDSSACGVQHTALLKNRLTSTTHAMDSCSSASSTSKWGLDGRLF